MSIYPMPDPDTVATVMGDLIGKECKVTEGEPVPLKPGKSFSVVLFRDGDGRAGPVMICDLPLCIFSGCALCVVPLEEAKSALKSKNLEGSIYDNYKEVVNIVGGTLFNSSSTPHLVLREIWYNPTSLSSELKPIFVEPAARLDADVEIEEYGQGKMTLLTL